MDPHFLGVLTSIVVGKTAYNPPYEKLKAKWAAAKETAKASGDQTTAEASDEPEA